MQEGTRRELQEDQVSAKGKYSKYSLKRAEGVGEFVDKGMGFHGVQRKGLPGDELWEGE